MPPITPDQVFPSLLAFKAALREWAIERNFTPHILDSDSHRVRAGCRTSPNCPFRIRCNWNDKRRTAKVTTCEDVHTCISTAQTLAHQDIKRPETGRLKFLVDVVPQLLDVTVTTSTTAIIDAVERRYGQRIPLRQAQKVKRALAGRIHGPCRYCKTAGHSKRNCPLRKEREAAGIMALPSNEELGLEGFQYDNHNHNNNDDDDDDGDMTPDGHDDEHQPQPDDRRCTQCFQPGHHRGNCPNETLPSTTHPSNIHPDFRTADTPTTSSQPGGYPIPYDPVNHEQVYGSTPLPPTSTQPDEPLATPSVMNPSLAQNNGRPPLTPKEKQAEAARLMQRAAKLMSEAAMMNAEASRLTASINVT
ncbi:MAG: hypothetical protein Q9200_006166 [Gallowayella weberi]